MIQYTFSITECIKTTIIFIVIPAGQYPFARSCIINQPLINPIAASITR